MLVLVYAVEAYTKEAILALELADTAEVLVTCARTRPLDACVEIVNEVVLADGQQGLVHSKVDGLALAGLLCTIQSRQGGCSNHQGVQVVAHVRSRKHGLLLGTVLHDKTGVSHYRQVVSSALNHLRITLLAKAGDMNDNELRIDSPENLVSDPLACPGAALRCLKEDIGILDHLEEVTLLNISQLAKKAHASEASIVRMAKHLGYNGFFQMRLLLSNDVA